MQREKAKIELLRFIVELIEVKKEDLTIQNILSYYYELSRVLILPL